MHRASPGGARLDRADACDNKMTMAGVTAADDAILRLLDGTSRLAGETASRDRPHAADPLG